MIIYNLAESRSENVNDRMLEDKDKFKELCMNELQIGDLSRNIRKIIRLGPRTQTRTGDDGRRGSGDPSRKARPLLIGLYKTEDKELILSKTRLLASSTGEFSRISISHDMTKREREENRKLLDEAHRRQNEDQSKNVKYRVVGPPSERKIKKFKVQR